MKLSSLDWIQLVDCITILRFYRISGRKIKYLIFRHVMQLQLHEITELEDNMITLQGVDNSIKRAIEEINGREIRHKKIL